MNRSDSDVQVKPRSSLKWVDAHGAYEAYEFDSFVQIVHHQTGAQPQAAIHVTVGTPWSHAAARAGSTFTFQRPDESALVISVPSIITSPLLIWLERVGRRYH